MVGGSGASCSNTLRVDLARERADALRRGRERARRRAARSSRGVAGDEHARARRAEAQRVLERVEAFEHREPRVAPGAPEARDERPVLHAAIIAAEPRGRLELGAAMKLEGIHHITAITGDAPRQRRVLHGRARPADGQAHRQPGRPDRLPPLLRRRGRLAGDGPDVLRVPGGRARASRARAWCTASSGAWPRRESLGVLARAPDGGRRGGRRSDGGACCSPIPRGSNTSSSLGRARDEPLRADSPEIPAEHALLGFEGVRAYSRDPCRSERPARARRSASARRRASSWEVRGESRGELLRLRPGPAGDQPPPGRRQRPPRRVRGADGRPRDLAAARGRRRARVRRR